jgi:two-component system response regulator HupR/HoxA
MTEPDETEHAEVLTLAERTPAFVLVLDDDPAAAQSIARVLKMLRRPTVVATTAAEAFELLRTRTISAIVSDERMPLIRGSKLLEVIARRHPEVRRILMTGHVDRAAVATAVNDAKVSAILFKPFSPKELEQALDPTRPPVANSAPEEEAVR